MDIEKTITFLQKIFPFLSVIDVVQFGLMWMLFKTATKDKEAVLQKVGASKKEVIEEVNNQYINKIALAVDAISSSILEMKEGMITRAADTKSQFEAIKTNLKTSDTVTDKILTKLEKIESAQERHTFIFENQNSEMYANRMANIKTHAKAFFVDWKLRLHQRFEALDLSVEIDSVFDVFFKSAMDDLVEWTLIFRTKIHPTHMAIIENEVNPKTIEVFAKRLRTDVFPAIWDLKADPNKQRKSLMTVEVFLDGVYREWEDLMEMTFRAKRARNEI